MAEAPSAGHDASVTASPLREDEGFSENVGEAMEEGVKSAGSDRQVYAQAWNWLVSLNDSERAEFAHRLLLSLPNPAIARIVRDANSRLHFDPVAKLPTEILLHILSFLEPKSLLNASLVSWSWQSRACEPRLWRGLFRLEGWTFDAEKIAIFERNILELIEKIRGSSTKGKRRRSDGRHIIAPSSKRLRAEPSRIRVERGEPTLPPGWREAVPNDETMTEEQSAEDLDMMDVENETTLADLEYDSEVVDESNSGNSLFSPLLKPNRLLERTVDQPRVDWQYLYNQRRRLERNWTYGRFTNFRLPHPDHPEEAHTQCIYTIQFSTNYLVSGSRDRTVRVWDLRTQRLKYPPLKGHEGSVLCLQFDEKQGIIISGGSDSHVIIWDLHTGQQLKKLRKAHAESVLNLRFDDRYLVTCSKDKTIKVWNRKQGLMPNDPDYPTTNQSKTALHPPYIVNQQEYVNGRYKTDAEPLDHYTCLMQLQGHGAAVNAIQIHDHQVVSASGDRKIILWDIRTGNLIRIFTGHSKGIACVQYDGRRIISGSSDNSVRIFDSSTAAQVAVLEGHRHLVRTVQAEFGDVAGDEELQEQQAREDDRMHDRERILQRRKRSFFPQEATWPQRYFVYGAKLPAGGGGNRWSKIVSGSYDERIIIWRRDGEGTWVIANELRQEDAMRATASACRSPGSRLHPSMPQPGHEADVNSQPPANEGVSQEDEVDRDNEPSLAENHNGGAAPASSSHPHHALNPPPMGPAQPTVTNAYAQPSFAPGFPAMLQSLQQSSVQGAHIPAHQHPHHPHYQHHVQALPNQANPLPNGQGRQGDGAGASRVFKLQFDARRIVCCSQQTVIVGWDFANGDQDIIEASQFFGEPSQ